MFRFPHVPVKLLQSLALGWAWRQAGAGKQLRERWIHVPDAVLVDAAAAAGITPDQWRQVEAVQVAILEGKVLGQ